MNYTHACAHKEVTFRIYVIVAVYVDVMNLIGTPAELEEIAASLEIRIWDEGSLGKLDIVSAWRSNIV